MLQPPSLTGHAAPDTRVLLARHGPARARCCRCCVTRRPCKVNREVRDEKPPQCTLRALRGRRFELGEPPSAMVLEHLQAALPWATDWLSRPKVLRHA